MINLKQAKKFCADDISLIENYDAALADKSLWVLHHRPETHFSDKTLRPACARLSKRDLKALDMYYSRPAEELIFMTKSDHVQLHRKLRPNLLKFIRKVFDNVRIMKNELRD